MQRHDCVAEHLGDGGGAAIAEVRPAVALPIAVHGSKRGEDQGETLG